MNNVFKAIVLFSLIISTKAFAQTGSPAEPCIQGADLELISQNFEQFKEFVTDKSEYCEADLGLEWLKVANSMATLINIKPDEPETDQDDALTFKTISEKDWWAYFTKRANQVVIERGCPAGVVAYVQLFGRNLVHVCELFFELNVYSQASTMMHEVRHFDGHRHWTCSQGNEEGLAGACDQKITNKGSYAISVQTLVGMARSDQTEGPDQSALEGEAVYMAFNKFNEVPKVKLERSIYLSNSLGETYRWILGKGAQLVNTLSEPAKVLMSGSFLTIYPLDPSVDAYRMDKKLTIKSKNPGLYAVHYNGHTPEERADFNSISYFGTGGLLKNNTLTTFCNYESTELDTQSLDDKGQFTTLISLQKENSEHLLESYLLGEDGKMLKYKCAGPASSVVEFTESELTIASDSLDIANSFGFDGHQYSLMKNGVLMEMLISGNKIEAQEISMPIENSDWVSATPFSRSELF